MWTRLTRFVGSQTGAKFRHSGRKGSTRIGWQGMDQHLETGNWDLVSASFVAWSSGYGTPRQITRDEINAAKTEFVAAA